MPWSIACAPTSLEPSNVDVLAFHEGFADIVALFQHFSFRDILREQIQATRSDIRTRTPLVDLAQQFGYAIGAGRALRSALDIPDARLYSWRHRSPRSRLDSGRSSL